ncbi:MAG: 50S ribosomal protein L29 [Bacteroidota bacterium]|nr:50S ribosomal protein L29 [Bacteroidota bacterium]
MKYKDLVLLSSEELNEKLVAEADMLNKLKFAHAISPIENPMKIRYSRRALAMIKTEITKRNNSK